MDFHDSPAEAAFRTEVRDFIAREYRSDGDGDIADARGAAHAATQGGPAAMQRYQAWMKKLAAKGWVAPAWPQEYGGAGMTIMEQFVFNEEMAKARAPRPGGIGVGFAGPTIIVYGAGEQKTEHLPGILSGDAVWCQGFSEPGSGSDLASLQTSAVKDGDDYIVNGQKIWTSGAQYAQRMILLARTDPAAPKHKGISYFLLDMKSPGVSVRPLVNMAGTPMFNEVFFDNVRVPRKDLLGEENRGWYVAATTLDFERSSIGSSIAQGQQVEDLVLWVKDRRGEVQPTIRCELAERAIEAETARLLSYRVISMQNRGLVPNHEAAAVKLYAAELNQRVANTAIKLAGLYGQLEGDRNAGAGSAINRYAPNKGRFARAYLGAVASTIAGGTSEVNRNIIATRGLGLPRD
ncbi:MAG: acyl-CoA dehydrogenase family protein [Dehalococcoidia bacterium]|nr:acyl-CoA dehydrogenase family protein [Dehalococcoidia bacterium]